VSWITTGAISDFFCADKGVVEWNAGKTMGDHWGYNWVILHVMLFIGWFVVCIFYLDMVL
jgi:hypothetical protein